jgi:hypothetical protein
MLHKLSAEWKCKGMNIIDNFLLHFEFIDNKFLIKVVFLGNGNIIPIDAYPNLIEDRPHARER